MFSQKTMQINNGWQHYNNNQDIGLLTLYDMQQLYSCDSTKYKRIEPNKDYHNKSILRSSAKFHLQTVQSPSTKRKTQIQDQQLNFQRPKFKMPSSKNKTKLKYSIKKLIEMNNLRLKYQEPQESVLSNYQSSQIQNTKMPKIKLLQEKQSINTIIKNHYHGYIHQKQLSFRKQKTSLPRNLSKVKKFLTLNSQPMEAYLQNQAHFKTSTHSPQHCRHSPHIKINIYNFGNVSFDEHNSLERFTPRLQETNRHFDSNHKHVQYKQKKQLSLNNHTKKLSYKPLQSIKLKLNKTKRSQNKTKYFGDSSPSSMKDSNNFMMNNDIKLKEMLTAYCNKPNYKKQRKNLIIFDEKRTI